MQNLRSSRGLKASPVLAVLRKVKCEYLKTTSQFSKQLFWVNSGKPDKRCSSLDRIILHNFNKIILAIGLWDFCKEFYLVLCNIFSQMADGCYPEAVVNGVLSYNGNVFKETLGMSGE